MAIAPKLTALKEVHYTDIGHITWDMTDFLERIPTALHVFIVPEWLHISQRPSAITQHGSTLRKLTISSFGRRRPDDILVTDADLVLLCKGLPHLEELGLDLDRDKAKNDWPYNTLDIIAGFPSLRRIQLSFELSERYLPPSTPLVTVSAARQLFSYLRERNKNI